MIKVCPECHATCAGGVFCVECDARLADPFENADEFPEDVWWYIRALYAARRGMLVRTLGLLIAPLCAFIAFRQVVLLGKPWAALSVAAGLVAGFASWWVFKYTADRMYKVWTLPKGRLRYGRYLKAMMRRPLRFFRRPAAPLGR